MPVGVRKRRAKQGLCQQEARTSVLLSCSSAHLDHTLHIMLPDGRGLGGRLGKGHFCNALTVDVGDGKVVIA